MVAPAARIFATAARVRARRLLRGQPIRIAAAGARAGDVVHVLDDGGQPGERTARAAGDRRVEVVRDEGTEPGRVDAVTVAFPCARCQSRIFAPSHAATPGRAQDLLERALHVADAVRHAREIRVHGDRHEFRPRRRFGVEPLELVHDAPIHLDRRMVLQRHHDDVVQLEIIGQGDDRLVRGLERHRLVVEHPVADIFDAGGREMIERVEGLREAGAEPAARRPAPEFGDDRHRLVDHRLLVVELVHRHLVEAVRVELPAVVDAGLRDLRIGLAHARIERDGRRDLQPLEHRA